MRLSRLAAVIAVVPILAALSGPASAAPITPGGSTEVTVGSNDSIFTQNKQNEPALAVNPVHPTSWRPAPTTTSTWRRATPATTATCPFTPGVGVSGVQFSIDPGTTWTQPTYTGSPPGTPAAWASRSRRAPPPTDTGCVPTRTGRSARCRSTPRTGWSPTATRSSPSGRGPAPTAASRGPTARGCTTPTSPRTFPGQRAFTGAAAIAVSRTDDVAGGRRRRTTTPGRTR